MTVIARELLEKDGIRARLLRYEPDVGYERHSHSNIWASVMLLGSMQEQAGGRDQEFLSPHCAVMPPDMVHANKYGPNGALELVFDFEPELLEERFGLCETARSARPVESGDMAGFVASLLDSEAGSRENWRDDGLVDILTLILVGREVQAKSPPAWFSLARECFDDDPGAARVLEVAALCGVHRVHLVRVFKEQLNMTPTEYRLQVMTAKAVSLLNTGVGDLSAIAADAGFSDASHCAREMRRRVGISPGSLRKIFKN